MQHRTWTEDSPQRLGLLDLCQVAGGQSHQEVLFNTFEVALQAEALGYSRYWVAEHHTPNSAHGCPELLVGLLARTVTRLRVGTAGVLLNYYSPLKVAKNFRLLQALFPGRIDLGVGAGRVKDEVGQALLGGAGGEDYGAKVADLLAYLRDPKIPVPPSGVGSPDVWVLGSGGMGSAILAAQQGTAFSQALFLGKDDPAPLQRYRTDFHPRNGLPAPKWNIAVAGVCADTEGEALHLAQRFATPYIVPDLVGAPEQCRTKLLHLKKRYQADEIIFLDLCADLSSRLRSCRLLAEVMNLSAGG